MHITDIMQGDSPTFDDRTGIHFYTLNRSEATRTIFFASLGIPRKRNALVRTA
jgi:5,10-methylenetetrahydrofolate reductase